MAGTVAIQIILAVLGSGGLITAIAALRKGRIEGQVQGDRSTLDQMSELNDRLNADNKLLRVEIRELRQEMQVLRHRVTELEHALSEAQK